MTYRCPYCKEALPDPVPRKCPECGRVMIKPKTKKSESERRKHDLKLKAIAREYESKQRELGLKAPAIKRGPVFYFAMMMVLLLIGGAVIQATGKGGGRKMRDGKIASAMKSVDALAEALGRYRFHCGVYPEKEEGLVALANKFSNRKGWVGPYIPKMLPDPWKHEYVYEPLTNGTPVVLSLGPDGIRGTADDISPDPELFTKPFRDTTWTNDWAPFNLRGYIIVPSRKKTSN